MKSILNVTHLPSALLSAGRFVLHFVEMLVAMMAGMLVFHALPLGLERTSTPYQVAMAIAMTMPMVAWMRVRGHGWRHGIEMSIGMLAPWAAVLVLVGMGAASVLPWLVQADGLAMLLGMLAAMLLRPGHYAHGHHHTPMSNAIAIDPVCGMAVDPSAASRSAEHDNQTYYFCAPGCRKSFLADPTRFLASEGITA
jgi:YHS domain-containing protein